MFRKHIKGMASQSARNIESLALSLVLAGGLVWADFAIARDEVIVSAQRRDESVQDVSFSISAVSGEKLEQLGADNLFDFASTIPGLVATSPQPGIGVIIIRGISDGVQGAQGGALNALYIDEIPITTKADTPDLKLFDFERVEVLRGPQGTLYGINSMGGTLRMVSKKPDLSEFSGMVSATGKTIDHGGEGFNVRGLINIPIMEDKIALRASAYYYDEPGWIDDVGRGVTNINDEETYGGRLSLRFMPHEDVDIIATIIHQSQDLGAPFEVTSELDADLLTTSNFVAEPLTEEYTSYNLTVNWDLGFAEFVSSTSYVDRENTSINDETIFVASQPMSPFPGPTEQDVLAQREIFVQEARLVSQHEGPLQWTAGLFYLDSETKTDACFFTQDGDVILEMIGAGMLILPDNPDCVFLADDKEDFETFAIYGELYYNITERLKATVGARYFDNSDKNIFRANGLFNGGPSESIIQSSEDDVVFRFNISYDATDDLLFYIQAAEGFREGGGNPALPDREADIFTSDSLWNYEFGFKSSWWDGRVVANGAFYYIDWSNIQTQLVTPNGFSFIDNLGSATIYGFEGEFTIRPTDRLTINLGINLADPEFDANQPLLLGVVDISNGVLPGVPRVTFSGSMRYEFPIANTFQGFGQIDVRHIGESFAGPGEFFEAFTQQGDYTLLNLRVGIQNERWGLTFFADNVTNERAPVLNLTAPFEPTTTVLPNTPRSFGVTATARF